MPMNGWDGRSGSMHYGWAREEVMRVSMVPLATIFVTHDISKKTANQNKPQQTSRNKRKRKKKSANKMHTAKIMFIKNPNAKEAQQKEEETHVIGQSNTNKKHGQHKQQK